MTGLYIVMISLGFALGSQAAPVSVARGKAIYVQRCAVCHDAGADRTPSRKQLAARSRKEIVHSLAEGLMKVQANGLTQDGIRSVAAFLTTTKPATVKKTAAAPAPATRSDVCAGAGGAMTLDPPAWNGWGRDLENSRYQPHAGLRAQDVLRLQVKWAFGLPGKGVRGQPTVVGGRVYVAGPAGQVYALDAKSGCIHWTYEAQGNARSSISVGRLPGTSPAKYAAYFGDDKGFVHAVDALTGAPLWKVQADAFPGTLITGAPTLFENRLYVPLSSSEEKLAGFLPKYECCKFRGGIVALDAASGKQIWKTYVIAEEPKPFKKGPDGRDIWGPAGAAIWSAPTIDSRRRLLYAVTGNSYTDAEASTTEAVLALDLETGRIRWSRQQTKHDNYLLNCNKGGNANCPDVAGDDFDFGASPILHTLADGRQVLFAGQKSGTLYALDPDKDGELLWKVRLSPGSFLGGIQWGPAADADRVYVAISDVVTKEGAAPGLYAVSAATGERLWSTPAPQPPCAWGTNGCSHAQSAAVTAIPGVVFSGALDGHLRAYSSHDGAIVWDVDTAKSWPTVNGIEAKGGSLDTGGAVVVDGTLYATSGYALLAGRPGNVLLAFTIDGK